MTDTTDTIGTTRTTDTTDTVDALVLDLLEWIGPDHRPYADVMDAWRTSCPRLPVWEEANARGFLCRHRSPDGEVVSVSVVGAAYLSARRVALPS